MWIKIHKSYRNVVAVCDSDLIGKKFEEGIKQLDVKDSFYKGEEIPREKLIEVMKFQSREDSTFNIVGEESIKAGIEAGVISAQGIKRIKGIPYALVLL